MHKTYVQKVCILLSRGYKNRCPFFSLFVCLIQKMSVCILRFILVSGLWASPKKFALWSGPQSRYFFVFALTTRVRANTKKYLLFDPSHRAKYFLVERPQTLIQEFSGKYSRTFLYAVHLPKKIQATIYSNTFCSLD